MTHQPHPPGRTHRGFTLIELMIVVLIIGLLASMAIPAFQALGMRARKAEREATFASIMRVVNDYWVQHGRLPGGLVPDLPQNPPGLADGSKQRFAPTLGRWGDLGWIPDGELYFRYDVTGSVTDSGGVLFLTGKADLDHDGVLNIKTITYTLHDGKWQFSSEFESESPF